MPKRIPEGSLVYVIQSGSLVKIGTTTNLEVRMKALATANPSMTLLGTTPGDSRREAALHREFKEWRVTGEWFDLPPKQMTVLRARLKGELRKITLPPGRAPSAVPMTARKPVWRKVRGKSKIIGFSSAEPLQQRSQGFNANLDLVGKRKPLRSLYEE